MNFLPALMIPIYTHGISVSVYGVLEVLNRTQEVLMIILSFGLRSALVTFYQMYRDEGDRQKKIYSTAIQFLSGFGLATLLLMMAAAKPLSRVLFEASAYANAIILVLAGTYLETIFQMAVLYLQSELRSVLYVTIFTTRLILAILLNLWFVCGLRWGLTGILWATLIHTATFAVLVVAYMFRRTGFFFDWELLQDMVRFGAPLMIGGFAGFLLNNGDRYFLNIYSTRAEVGLYGLGYKIGMLPLALVLMPFQKIWGVTMVDISQRPAGSHDLGKIATYFLSACTLFTLALSLLGPYLIHLLSERSYWSAYRVIPLVGAAYVLYGWTTIMDASFYLTKRTSYKVYTLATASVVVVLLYWWLIPRYGMMGAAWATLGGFASLAALTWIFAQRIYLIHYEIGRITVLFVLAFVFYQMGVLIPITPIASGLLLRTAVVLAFPVALWGGGFVRQEERRACGEYWQTFRIRYLSGQGI